MKIHRCIHLDIAESNLNFLSFKCSEIFERLMGRSDQLKEDCEISKAKKHNGVAIVEKVNFENTFEKVDFLSEYL